MVIEPAATPTPGPEPESNSLAATTPAAQAEASAAAIPEPAKATAAPVAEPAPPQTAAPVTPIPELTADSREGASIRRAPLVSGASPRSRFPLLAASIAIAAALGSIAGGGAFSAASHLFATAPPVVKAEPIEDIKELQARVAQLRTSVKGLTDSVATLRMTGETAGKGSTAQLARINEQLAKLAEAVERSERAQAEPVARLSKAVEALERADRRASAPPAQPETTGSIPAQRAEPPKPAIVGGWLLRSVIDGVAVLETHDRVIEVEIGDTIRGVGRVDDIRRQHGRWVVATTKGLIVTRR